MPDQTSALALCITILRSLSVGYNGYCNEVISVSLPGQAASLHPGLPVCMYVCMYVCMGGLCEMFLAWWVRNWQLNTVHFSLTFSSVLHVGYTCVLSMHLCSYLVMMSTSACDPYWPLSLVLAINFYKYIQSWG